MPQSADDFFKKTPPTITHLIGRKPNMSHAFFSRTGSVVSFCRRTAFSIVCSAVAVVFAICCCSALFAADTKRPNLVVFLSDDHSVLDSSVYGSRDIRTPNMQRIAAAGMTFDRAFVASPSCAPSRAALLTGLMPARNGAEANHSRPRAEIKKLPAYLKELGYEVVSFGKVGHYAQTPEYGFDIARHFQYHEDVAVPKAIEWLKNRKSDQPLCLFVGTNWPHVPWPENKGFEPDAIKVPSNHVDTRETRDSRTKYYSAVEKMDSELGEVYDLARERLGDNTLFLHTSDHGAQWPFGKWNLYDGGIRTPLLAVWPGKIQPQSRTSAMVSWVDILPTLIEAAGEKPPADLDGKSFVPVLKGETTKHRDAIYTVHSSDGNFNVYPMRSVRTEQFKYIRNLHPEFRYGTHVNKAAGTEPYWPSWEKAAREDSHAAEMVAKYFQRPAEELYDLQADPLEQKNLIASAEHQTTAAQLRKQLDDWLKAQGDKQTVFGMPDLLPNPSKKPNVILVLVDDMGSADLACFGGTEAKTPVIDRLASEGIRFQSFYVNSPICSPSRTALTTGHYPARHRITSFLAARAENERRGIAQWLDVNAPTLARMISSAGYVSGHFGKWHMGGQRNVGEAPLITEYGFKSSLTNFEGLGPRVLPLKDAYDGQPPQKHALGSDTLGRGPIEWDDRNKITQRFVSQAIEFIDEAERADQPFYINLWPDDVHSPFFPPEGKRGDGKKRTLYNAVLENMDAQLAPLFDRVRSDPKLRNNTLILLASDNGPEPGAGSAGVLRGNKGELWEGGIRSPLIAWGPGLIENAAAGSINNTTVLSSIDLTASLLVLCNGQKPEGYVSDGENLLAAVLGKSTANRSGPLFWRRPPDRPGGPDNPLPDLAVRDGQWKLVCELDGTQPQLFDLSKDVSEQNNVADSHKQIVNRLKKSLLDWNATLPEDGTSSAN